MFRPWGRFAGHTAPAVRDAADDGIRWELVARVREKIAMGIYDQPALFERACELMAEDAGA